MDVSGFDDLAGAQGVTRWTREAPAPDLEEQLRAEGRRVVLLDGTDIEDKAGFLVACEQAFGLPDWFGRNWDALEDSLADLDVGEGMVVLWTGWELFAESEPDEYATALDVFSDAARRFAVDDDSFVVLLLGEDDPEPEPDLDVDLDVEPELELELELEQSYGSDPARPEDGDPSPG